MGKFKGIFGPGLIPSLRWTMIGETGDDIEATLTPWSSNP